MPKRLLSLSTRFALALGLLLPCATAAHAADDFIVTAQQVSDLKPIFATVESVDVAAARARIGGTIVDLRVDEGDNVTPGQVLAIVGDEKLALQVEALGAQIAALTAQQSKAHDDLRRAQELFKSGTIAQARLDEAKAAADIANNQLKARQADRSVINQQMTEGQILAPAAGRVLQVLPTKGSVVMPGDQIARIAAENYILRLQLPERHAQALTVGDVVRLGENGEASQGIIQQVYPEIINGRVTADAKVADLGSYFVGQRLRVWMKTGERTTFIIPKSYLLTRAGLDYVTLRQDDGSTHLVPVQRGSAQSLAETAPAIPNGVEILAGVRAGDHLLPPNPSTGETP